MESTPSTEMVFQERRMRKDLLSTHDAPFGFQFQQQPHTDDPELPIASKDRYHQKLQPQNNQVIQVPNLDNVDMFFSDSTYADVSHPLTVERHDTQQVANCLEPVSMQSMLEDMRPQSEISEHATRVLSSSWKFNPYLGASEDAFQLYNPIERLTKEEYSYIEDIKNPVNVSLPREVALRQHNALGQIELHKINKRNRRDPSVLTWPDDIPEVGDNKFNKEVETFYESRSLPLLEIPSAQDLRGCGERHQDSFKDSGICVEEAFEKEADKSASPSTKYSESANFQECLTSPFTASSTVSNAVDSHMLENMRHDAVQNPREAKFHANVSYAGVDSNALSESRNLESVHDSLILFDDANASYVTARRHQPYDLQSFDDHQKVKEAIADTLFAACYDWNNSQSSNFNLQGIQALLYTQYRNDTEPLSLTQDCNIGQDYQLSLDSSFINEERLQNGPSGGEEDEVLGVNTQHSQQVVNRESSSLSSVAMLHAAPSPASGPSSVPYHLGFTPLMASSESEYSSTDRSRTRNIPLSEHQDSVSADLPEQINLGPNRDKESFEIYDAPTPMQLGSSSPHQPDYYYGDINAIADSERQTSDIYDAPTPMQFGSSSPSQADCQQGSSNTGLETGKSTPWGAVKPIQPAPSPPHSASVSMDAPTAASYGAESHPFFAPKPIYPPTSDAAASMEAFLGDSGLTDSAGDMALETPSSPSRQLRQDLVAATSEGEAGSSLSQACRARTPRPLNDWDCTAIRYPFGESTGSNAYTSPYASVESVPVSNTDDVTQDPLFVRIEARKQDLKLQTPNKTSAEVLEGDDSNHCCSGSALDSPRTVHPYTNAAPSSYLEATFSAPKLSHAETNDSLEVFTGSSPVGNLPSSPSPNDRPNENFVAGTHKLASYISRPVTPKMPTAAPRAQSPSAAALHLNMPKEHALSPTPDPTAPAFSTRRPRKRARTASTATPSVGRPRPLKTDSSQRLHQSVSAPIDNPASSSTEPSAKDAPDANKPMPKKRGRPPKKKKLGEVAASTI